MSMMLTLVDSILNRRFRVFRFHRETREQRPLNYPVSTSYGNGTNIICRILLLAVLLQTNPADY